VQQSSKARIDKFLVFQKIVDPVCLHCGHAHDPQHDQSLEFQAPDASELPFVHENHTPRFKGIYLPGKKTSTPNSSDVRPFSFY